MINNKMTCISCSGANYVSEESVYLYPICAECLEMNCYNRSSTIDFTKELQKWFSMYKKCRWCNRNKMLIFEASLCYTCRDKYDDCQPRLILTHHGHFGVKTAEQCIEYIRTKLILLDTLTIQVHTNKHGRHHYKVTKTVEEPIRVDLPDVTDKDTTPVVYSGLTLSQLEEKLLKSQILMVVDREFEELLNKVHRYL